MKNLCNFETQIWLEIITSRDAKGALPALLQKLVGEFFFFPQGNLENLVGNLEGILRDFSDPQNKGSKISGKISEHFS